MAMLTGAWTAIARGIESELDRAAMAAGERPVGGIAVHLQNPKRHFRLHHTIDAVAAGIFGTVRSTRRIAGITYNTC